MDVRRQAGGEREQGGFMGQDEAFDVSLAVEGLCGGRGGFALFNDVSFSLAPGEALRVIGPNGSGKSTLLRAIAGLVRPEAGRVTLTRGGTPTERQDAIHYLGHANAMKPQLTVTENLSFWTGFCGGGDWRAALHAVGLARIAHLPFGYLSAGQKRRVAIARILATPRPVWLVDEPTAGLDRESSALFEDLLDAHLAAGGIVAGATHVPLGSARWREFSTRSETAGVSP
jgi:heme exporter protein A